MNTEYDLVDVPEDVVTIYLSFWWHRAPEQVGFRRVLRFFLSQGYQIAGDVTLVPLEAGRPVFPEIGRRTGNNVVRRRVLRTIEDIEAHASEWAPYELSLRPPAAGGVACTLGYCNSVLRRSRASETRTIVVSTSVRRQKPYYTGFRVLSQAGSDTAHLFAMLPERR